MARQRRRKGDPVHGWLNLNKPSDMTSTQAVGIVKRLFNAQKAGHGGTLDPLADGILPIALGEATKTSAYAMDADKDYMFDIAWGRSTKTQDLEGDTTGTSDVRPSPEQVAEVLRGFVGDIEQVPPQFSAIKVNGERAYDLARDGETVELKPRKVQLFEARVDPASTPDKARLHVTCGKGFYIRALVRDLAVELGAEGHVSLLRRARVGDFALETAINIDDLQAMDTIDARKAVLRPIETALDDIPKVEVDSPSASKIRMGRDVVLLPYQIDAFKNERTDLQGEASDDRLAFAHVAGRAVALGEVRAGYFRPSRVFQVE